MGAAPVSIVIVNYNGGDYLIRCLRAVAAQTLPPSEVIIVDNGSTDGSLDGIDALPIPVQIVAAGTNLGFAAANNLAARQATAPWIATLNPDAFPEADWLWELMRAVHRHPDVAMFGSTQVMADEPARLDGTGDVFHISGLVWRRGHGAAAATVPAEGEVFASCAAAALYRRDRFLAVGGFEESFFCYCEDVDLAFRLRLRGERCVQVASARVCHVASGISGYRSDFATYHGTRNRIWLFIRNLPTGLLIALLPGHITMNLVMLGRSVLQRNGTATWRGMCDALRGLPQVLAARRIIQSGRTVGMLRIAGTIEWSLRTRHGYRNRPVRRATSLWKQFLFRNS
jgi:N-acetylglucosaminyl-diphospho-decaprenol L-rhamnosyltransferase